MSDTRAGGTADLDPDPLDRPVQEAAAILRASRYCIALTGAGISAESGIPTFRGKDGLWTKHGEPPLNQYQKFLDDPREYWDGVRRRRENPDELAATMGEAVPNDGHFALAELERIGVLKHTITQNVDNLHRMAGTQRITEIHGNLHLLRCVDCGSRTPFDEIPELLPPRCDRCGGIVKTDGVMFGEPIPSDALAACQRESERADCMLLVGTTAVVSPAADFAWMVRSAEHPLIEVNPEPTVISDFCAVAIRAAAGDALPRLTDLLKRAPGADA